MYFSNPHSGLGKLKHRQQYLNEMEFGTLRARDALDKQVAVAAEERHEAEQIFNNKKRIHITKKKERANVNKQYMYMHKASGLTTRQMTHVAKLGKGNDKRSTHLEEAIRLGEEAQQALLNYDRLTGVSRRRRSSVTPYKAEENDDGVYSWMEESVRSRRSVTPIKEEDEDDDDYEDGYDYNNEQDYDYRPRSSTSSMSSYRWY